MNYTEIRKLVKLVETSDISELEIEEGGSRVRIVKKPSSNGIVQVAESVIPVPSFAPGPTQLVAPVQPDEPQPTTSPELVKMTSPMVGTYYTAPSPEAPPYVQVGDQVVSGQVLCIVEAMKLMNEIESEMSGRIVEISVENAQPVEFGQLLFVIDPTTRMNRSK